MPDEIQKTGEQKAAESEVRDFHDDLGPFVVAAETTRMAMVFTDAKASGNPIIFANDSFLKLTGCGREEVLGQSFNFLMAQGASPDTLKTIEDAFRGETGGDHDPEIRYRRKDDTIFWATVFVSPVRDKGGDIVQHFPAQKGGGSPPVPIERVEPSHAEHPRDGASDRQADTDRRDG